MPRKNVSWYVVGVLLIVFGMVLSACAPAATPTPTPQPKPAATSEVAAQPTAVPTTAAPAKKLVIRYVFKFAESVSPPSVLEAVQKHAAELGVDYLQVGPQGGDVAKQVEMIESFVSAKVDVLVVSSLGPATCAAVDAAMDAGIPVVMADGDCPDSKRIGFIGSDNYSCGADAATLFAEAVKDKGHQKVLVVTGTPGAQNLQEREQGFKDGLAKLGVDVEYLPTIPCYEDTQKGVDAIESSLRGDPTITGIYVTAFWPFQVEAANLPLMCEKVKAGKLTVVNVDALEGGLKLVEEGYIYGQVSQNLGELNISPLDFAYQVGIQHVKYPEICSLKNELITKDGGPGRVAAADFRKKMWTDFNWDLHTISPAEFQ